MRYSFVVLGLLLVFVPSWAIAGCSQIRDSDKQYYCYAMQNKEDGYCSQIRDNDMQNRCYAKLKHYGGYCSHIRDSDERERCYSEQGE